MLSRADAAALRDAVADALAADREFLHTTGHHREDGCYVVRRRHADSAGNDERFASFDALARLFERLPGEFGADDVGRAGVTGSRRHMVVWHLVEHPAFDCALAGRNPLRGVKTED